MEWKLFDGDISKFASQEWHLDRDAAPHLEQKNHKERLYKAAEYTEEAVKLGAKTAVDLGCGDGGLLSLLKERNIKCWGYDFTPANIEHAIKVRKVDARLLNFKNDLIDYGDIAILTEVLEHLENPHDTVKNLPCKYLVASSPFNESDLYHPPYHIWAWDKEGYQKMIVDNGFTILKNTTAKGWSQIILAVRSEK